MAAGFQSHGKKRVAETEEDQCEISSKLLQTALNGEHKTLEKAGADVQPCLEQ